MLWNPAMSNSLNHFRVYLDILDDYKLVLLGNDGLKWRFITALALAHRQQEDGFLPRHDESAVLARVTPDQFQAEMSILAQRGLVELRRHPDGDERWFVTNYKKRQTAASGTERSRQSRARTGRPVDKSRSSGWSGWLADLDDLDLTNQLEDNCNEPATIRCNVEAMQQHGIGCNDRTQALALASHITPDYIHAAVRDAKGNIGMAIWRMENRAVPVPVANRCAICGGDHPDDACAYSDLIQR